MMCYHRATDFSAKRNEDELSNNPIHFTSNKTIPLFMRYCNCQLHYYWMKKNLTIIIQ